MELRRVQKDACTVRLSNRRPWDKSSSRTTLSVQCWHLCLQNILASDRALRPLWFQFLQLHSLPAEPIYCIPKIIKWAVDADS